MSGGGLIVSGVSACMKLAKQTVNKSSSRIGAIEAIQKQIKRFGFKNIVS